MALCKCSKTSGGNARRNGCSEIDPCIRPDPPSDWQYVGKGNGHYDQDICHVYVGKKLGEYEGRPVLTTYGWKFRRGFFEFFLIALILAATATFWTLWRHCQEPEAGADRLTENRRNDAVAAQTHAAPERSSEKLYNCSSVLYLDARKMSFCCGQYQIFCEQKNTDEEMTEKPSNSVIKAGPQADSNKENNESSQTRQTGLDCETDFGDWANKWSIVQKLHCCRKSGKGCPPKSAEHSQPEVVDCTEGWDGWQEGWSVRKKKWCCLHERRGCENLTSTASHV